MSNPPDIGQIVQDILADMPLKEKAAIANLEEEDVPFLQYATFISCSTDQTINERKISYFSFGKQLIIIASHDKAPYSLHVKYFVGKHLECIMLKGFFNCI